LQALGFASVESAVCMYSFMALAIGNSSGSTNANSTMVLHFVSKGCWWLWFLYFVVLISSKSRLVSVDLAAFPILLVFPSASLDLRMTLVSHNHQLLLHLPLPLLPLHCHLDLLFHHVNYFLLLLLLLLLLFLYFHQLCR